MLPMLINGTLLGLSVAAPFGPVSLICVQRSLAAGPSAGVVSGLGAATVHGLFASLAIVGADMAASALTNWRTPIHAMSAVVLVCMGVRALLRGPPKRRGASVVQPHAAYLSGLMMGLSNPMTILPYLAIASVKPALGPVQQAFWTVPGVMLGALSWYAGLSGGAALLGRPLARAILPRLNIAGGAALIGFGVAIALR